MVLFVNMIEYLEVTDRLIGVACFKNKDTYSVT